jgi:hypothetical protein
MAVVLLSNLFAGINKVLERGRRDFNLYIPHKYDPNLEYQYETVNLIGNQGSHYVATFAWENNEPWGFTLVRAICPGSKK